MDIGLAIGDMSGGPSNPVAAAAAAAIAFGAVGLGPADGRRNPAAGMLDRAFFR